MWLLILLPFPISLGWLAEYWVQNAGCRVWAHSAGCRVLGIQC